MLQGIEKLDRELRRVRRPRSATITPTTGLPPVEVSVWDSVEITYEGESRRVRILAVMPWGIRCWDEDKGEVRAFRFEKIGAEGQWTPADGETDAAASG